MFTIKYRHYVLSPKQSSDGPFYDENEQIHGPFDLVSKEQDENGYTVVYCHQGESPALTFGPFNPPETAERPHPRPTLWVMNSAGATVAKYDL